MSETLEALYDGCRVGTLDDDEFIERIENLVTDRSAARRLGDEGQFSLAGAQAKTALFREPESGRWGIPKGRSPTTHILKPNRGPFKNFEINEHFCLQLAKALGLKAAESWTETIGGTPVLIVERYDRTRLNGRWVRVHQEDTCQALARAPEHKYQNEGGPSAKEIFGLIREHSSQPQEDALRFLDALIFNCLIGGTDAHAKNCSLLLAGGGQVRLAPLYDLISILPYQYEPKKAKLAMKIGSDYLLWKIGPRRWEKASGEWNLDRELVFGRIGKLADGILKAAETVGERVMGWGGTDREMLPKLVTLIKERALVGLRQFNG